MRTITAILAAASLALAGSAFAFDEQKTNVDDKPAAGIVTDGASGLLKPKSDGTSIQIPGLGNLGMIPKLDFGLDLLYGGREQSRAQIEETTPQGDGLQIRGSVRHRF